MKSKCCNAPLKEVGMGDFHDEDTICSMYWICMDCEKPSNPQRDSFIHSMGKYFNSFYSKKAKHNTLLFESVVLLPELWFIRVGQNVPPADYPIIKIRAANYVYTYAGKQNIKSRIGSHTLHTFTRII